MDAAPPPTRPAPTAAGDAPLTQAEFFQRQAGDAWQSAQAALQEGNLSNAIFWLERAARLAPQDPSIALALAAAGALLLAILVGLSPLLERAVRPLASALQVTPVVAVAPLILIWAGITTPDDLVKKRPYIIVGCFVFGMLLTPPDVISQALLAVPMWILFEIGVFFGRFIQRRDSTEADTEQ
jgi:sec-independent protein translocase protein TatC